MATALADKAATEWSGESQPMQWRLLAVVFPRECPEMAKTWNTRWISYWGFGQD